MWWPTSWLPSSGDLTRLGLFGDYVGGFIGTVVSVVTLVVVLMTWMVTRQTDARNRVLAVLAEMLATHDSVVEPDTAAKFLREFSAIYKITKRTVPSDAWSIMDRIDISYTCTFYGLNSEASSALSPYGPLNVKRVVDAASRLRDTPTSKFHKLFGGHQAVLSHYMRNLFAMYTLIDGSKLPAASQLELGKVVRSKLSNYDQALLTLNIVSHLGREWETTGIVEKFKPIANVPRFFFGFDSSFNIKTRFPTVAFEWEQLNAPRPSYRTVRLRNWSITLARY